MRLVSSSNMFGKEVSIAVLLMGLMMFIAGLYLAFDAPTARENSILRLENQALVQSRENQAKHDEKNDRQLIRMLCDKRTDELCISALKAANSNE